jgi:hypothetical protein
MRMHFMDHLVRFLLALPLNEIPPFRQLVSAGSFLTVGCRVRLRLHTTVDEAAQMVRPTVPTPS